MKTVCSICNGDKNYAAGTGVFVSMDVNLPNSTQCYFSFEIYYSSWFGFTMKRRNHHSSNEAFGVSLT